MLPELKLGRACGVAALGAGVAVASELRVSRSEQRITDRWRHIPIHPRDSTELGISFRPRQAETFGLHPPDALRKLLGYPFGLVRLGAYWNHAERQPGDFDASELDWQVDAAVAAGKRLILCAGAVKTFGYPEFFVPAHHLPEPLPEGRLITPVSHPELLDAARTFVTRVVERYRDCPAVVAWQVEHDAVDPLGLEHSWRLSKSFVAGEIDAARTADATRPILLNGFLPTSTPVGLQQWWRTRPQGDSVRVAEEMADIVGIDFYPRHALVALGPWSVYLAGSRRPWRLRHRRLVSSPARRSGHRPIVIEGQAEPWEAMTVPPSSLGRYAASCPPERLIDNYNECLTWGPPGSLGAYLFWGAEYWLARERLGDAAYLGAFARVLDEA